MNRFKPGQSVYFASHRLGARGAYKIIRLLPAEGGQIRYRIKGAHENFERVAEENQLTHG